MFDEGPNQIRPRSFRRRLIDSYWVFRGIDIASIPAFLAAWEVARDTDR
jgi:hypothetical protein